MCALRNHRLMLLASIGLVAPGLAAAQAVPASSDPAVAPPPAAATAGDRRVYTPADFARFAPKTAYDMLVQVPGFTIRSADQERGLGQASENVLINGAAHRQQDRRRDRRAAGGSPPRTSSGSRSSMPRASASPDLSGQVANVIVASRRPAAASSNGGPNIRAHYAEADLLRGSVSYTDQDGPGRIHAVAQHASRARCVRRPDRGHRSDRQSHRESRRSVPLGIVAADIPDQVRDRRAGILARQSDARLHALLGARATPARFARGSTATCATRITEPGARRLLCRLQRRLFVQGRARHAQADRPAAFRP